MGSEGWLDRAKVHVAMILEGAGYGGYNVLTKVSLSGGVYPFVFSTYCDGIGCITLFLYALYYERQHWRKMSLEVAGLILAMAFVGVYSQQALFLYGLQSTDVVFASTVMNCIPVWAYQQFVGNGYHLYERGGVSTTPRVTLVEEIGNMNKKIEDMVFLTTHKLNALRCIVVPRVAHRLP